MLRESYDLYLDDKGSVHLKTDSSVTVEGRNEPGCYYTIDRGDLRLLFVLPKTSTVHGLHSERGRAYIFRLLDNKEACLIREGKISLPYHFTLINPDEKIDIGWIFRSDVESVVFDEFAINLGYDDCVGQIVSEDEVQRLTNMYVNSGEAVITNRNGIYFIDTMLGEVEHMAFPITGKRKEIKQKKLERLIIDLCEGARLINYALQCGVFVDEEDDDSVSEELEEGAPK